MESLNIRIDGNVCLYIGSGGKIFHHPFPKIMQIMLRRALYTQ